MESQESRKRMSKQEKKRLKVEKKLESRKEKRDRRRESKREKRKEMLVSMTVGTSQTEERKEFIHQERRQTECIEAEIKRVATEGALLIIDCSYVDLMSDLEIGSLVSQVEQGTSYLHRQSKQHFKLAITSVTPQLKALFLKQHADKWPALVLEEDLVTLAELQDKEIVMLSPDAQDPMDEIDLGRQVYVIGGLVDRSHKKAATLEKALSRQVTVKRFPIQETIDPVSLTQKLNLVLNVNIVMQILHHRASGETWEEVFKAAIPQRQMRILDKYNKNYEQQTIDT